MRSLVAAADLVVTCSEADSTYFVGRGARTLIVPNGCSLPCEAALAEARIARGLREESLVAGFLGSAHPPNVEAARYIVEELAPRFANTMFLAAYAALIATPVAVGLGLIAAIWQGDQSDDIAKLAALTVPRG